MIFVCVSVHAESEIPSLGDTARGELSPMAEYKIGQDIMRRIRNDPDFLKDYVMTEYLSTIGNRLVMSSDKGELVNDFTFFAVRDPSLNAFAMPGGFIGVHTGLLLATQSESELASVLAHEVGHVTQRHIARMISYSSDDYMISIAAAALAVLAARAGGNMTNAVMMGGQGLAMQKQINFTRDAEKEADRVGFRILKNSGFDTSAMMVFFGRLQKASRNYSDAPSPYLRTHPLTSDRIADAEARARREPYHQHADSLDFYLMRARARMLQNKTGEDALKTAKDIFEDQVRSGAKWHIVSGSYGLAMVALAQKKPDEALRYWQNIKKLVGDGPTRRNVTLMDMRLEIYLAAGQLKEALKLAKLCQQTFSGSPTMVHRYADILMQAKHYAELSRFLRKEVKNYPEDIELIKQLANVYDLLGKRALMHMALADTYALVAAYPTAVEQLTLARNSPDVTFYDQSVIDAKEREWKAIIREEQKERGGFFGRGS